MKVAVALNIQLPHVIPMKIDGKMQQITFSPIATLPDDVGKKLVENSKGRYFEVTPDTKINPKEYTWREDFKKATIDKKFQALSNDQKAEVVALMDSFLLNPNRRAEAIAENDALQRQAEKDKAAAKAAEEAKAKDKAPKDPPKP